MLAHILVTEEVAEKSGWGVLEKKTLFKYISHIKTLDKHLGISMD
jgi:hypothetical protein